MFVEQCRDSIAQGRRLPVHVAEYVRLHNEVVGHDAYSALRDEFRTQIENAAQPGACKVGTP
jgi:hypothetical protein